MRKKWGSRASHKKCDTQNVWRGIGRKVLFIGKDRCFCRHENLPARKNTATHCNTLLHTATHRNILEPAGIATTINCTTLEPIHCHIATNCNTLQHTAKHLNLPALQVPSSTLCTTVHHTRTLGSATTAHCCTLPHPRTRRQ